ncbi:ABC transporter ATP-binding protein [Micromonospora sp. CB01531]|uniref:ABC transporter ATP-binding protein n=1 Tax=Micromonospora sp. CB01531 TaxID=1718947 RepID=UPI00093CD0BB|nr:ABC transporter ATP-binding protein [Micromonospora sp. CB01531]OKI65569.1 hypothetical protein A6A27_24670 [Micromonospora sp. CB01531]
MNDSIRADVPLLSVRDLRIVSDSGDEQIVLVDGVSFDVFPGETLCIVGESGSGKSLTVLAVMGLLPPALRIGGGSILFQGREMIGLPERELRSIRGRGIGMVFQDPMTSLNPLRRIGPQLTEAVRLHNPRASRKDASARIQDLLQQVGVTQPERSTRAYPHEWSGGMRQRAMIAMAMANDPDLLIADEPTTALDVTIQAQVMQSLARVRAAHDSAMILITHNLGLAVENASRIIVMYSGRIVEFGDVATVFEQPTHPYTRALLASLVTGGRERIPAIPGNPPSPRNRPQGCAFAPRCALHAGRDVCTQKRPELRPTVSGSLSACHFAEELLMVGTAS